MLPDPVLLASAAAIGFGGSLHCLGMCGGIAGALSLLLPEEVRRRPAALTGYLVAYNSGRILSYAAMGSLVGGLGAGLIAPLAQSFGYDIVRVLAAATLLAIGFTMIGVLKTDSGPIFRLTRPIAGGLAAAGRRVEPGRSPFHALAYGTLWGFLPCGMVYGLLPFAALSGSAVGGALVMLAFGMGTWPALLAGGFGAAGLKRKRWPAWAATAAGVATIGLAFASLLIDAETVARLCGLTT